MTPASAKAKGRKLQQWVRDQILSLFLELEPDDVRSTSMGAGGEDVTLSPAARRKVPYQIECKNKARSQIHTYYEQAMAHGSQEPLVIVKQDRKKALAILDAEAFFKLLKKLDNYKNKDSN
jgi:hypothetical protein